MITEIKKIEEISENARTRFIKEFNERNERVIDMFSEKSEFEIMNLCKRFNSREAIILMDSEVE